MRKGSALRVSVAAAGMALAAAAAALDPREFVAGWSIEAPAGAEVFDLPLTAEVYAAATIGQLAVLDANGEPQPFFRPRSRASRRRAAHRARGVAALCRHVSTRAQRRRHDGAIASTSVTVAPASRPSRPSRASCSTRAAVNIGPDRARARLARAAAAVPARRRRRAEHGPHELARKSDARRSRRFRSAMPRCAMRVCPCARPPAVTCASRRMAQSRIGTCCARRSSARLPSARRRSACAWRRYPRAPSPTTPFPKRCISTQAARCRFRSATLAFGDNDGWVRADVAASRSLDGPWIPVAYGELMYRAVVRGPRVRERADRGSARYEARYWRVVPSAPPRGERLELELTFPQETCASPSTAARPICSRPARCPRRPGPTRRSRRCGRRSTPPADVVPLATLGARRELGGPARARRGLRVSRGARRAVDRADRRRACRRGDGG